MLGTRTWGSRMEGAAESIELRRHPNSLLVFVRILFQLKRNPFQWENYIFFFAILISPDEIFIHFPTKYFWSDKFLMKNNEGE